MNLFNTHFAKLKDFEQINPLCPSTHLAQSAGDTEGGGGYFDGDVYTTGSYLPSDAFLKQNIQEVSNSNAMNLINALNPATYNYDTAQFSAMNLPTGMHYGLISEQVEQVLPNLIKQAIQPAETDSLGLIISPAVNFKALNYTEIIPLLIAGIQQMDSTNNAQQQQNEMLLNQLNTLQQQVQLLLNCCQGGPVPPQGMDIPNGQGNNNRSQTIVELSNNTIILDQNSPNPFAEQTTITFIITKEVKDAQILFSDDKGSVIKTVQINSRGAGSLLVYASNLSTGIYTYSLLADGKLIDTKKMICQKR